LESEDKVRCWPHEAMPIGDSQLFHIGQRFYVRSSRKHRRLLSGTRWSKGHRQKQAEWRQVGGVGDQECSSAEDQIRNLV
jgi:hypothetical protein